MFRVHGLYGHVRRVDCLSAWLLLSFLAAFQIIGAVVLAPVLFLYDPAHAWFLDPAAYLSRYGLWLIAVAGGLFAARFFLTVRTLQSVSGFRFVEQRTEPRWVNTVETMAIAAGLPLPRIAVIETSALNAFACGYDPRSAVVVTTRGLLRELNDDELAAVAAHEIAHIRNRDIRLMTAVHVLMTNLWLLRSQVALRFVNFRQVLLCVVIPPMLVVLLASHLVVFLCLLLSALSRRAIGRFREFSADAEAVRLTHNPAALISALRKVDGQGALDRFTPGTEAMLFDGGMRAALGQSPEIAKRIAVLTRLTGDMIVAGGPGVATPPMPAAAAANVAEPASALDDDPVAAFRAAARRDPANYQRTSSATNWASIGARLTDVGPGRTDDTTRWTTVGANRTDAGTNGPRAALKTWWERLVAALMRLPGQLFAPASGGGGRNLWRLKYYLAAVVLAGELIAPKTTTWLLSYRPEPKIPESVANAVPGYAGELLKVLATHHGTFGPANHTGEMTAGPVNGKFQPSEPRTAEPDRAPGGGFQAAGGPNRVAFVRPGPDTELAELTRRAAVDPAAARCFVADLDYRPGGQGLKPIYVPDEMRIEALTGPGALQSLQGHGSLEELFARRVFSLRRVKAATEASIDQALHVYVQTRKLTLALAHLFYGEDGLSLLSQTYAAAKDQEVLRQLRRRVASGASSLTGDARFAAEVAFLLAAPAEFLPCQARVLFEVPHAAANSRFDSQGFKEPSR